MPKKGVFTKILAIAGTLLACFPILAPILLFLSRVGSGQMLHFDYLIPAELFPFAFVGGGLLLWAALRARSRQKLIGWTLGSAAGAVVLSQVVAVISGLASGAIPPEGFIWVVVVGLIIIYTLAVAVMGVGGILLLRDLFKKRDQ